MSDTEVLAAAFEEHRDHLRGVAYRLLGSTSDAEDAVQDTWLRLTGADTSEVKNLGGWLTGLGAECAWPKPRGGPAPGPGGGGGPRHSRPPPGGATSRRASRGWPPRSG